jgi:imidazolonepropionase-like amidohydrolase
MNRFSAAVLCLLLASCGTETPSESTKTGGAEKDVVFLSGARLIPGDGNPPIEEATVIIENGVIKNVGKKKEFYAPKGSLPIELDGKTIVPLFVNLHAYAGLNTLAGEFGAKNYKRETVSSDLNRYGYYGVGAVLAGGDSDGLAFQIRDELREAKATGAMLYTSGRGIAARGSSGIMGSIPLLVTGEADARKAVGELADRNVDAIVLWAEGMKADASNAVVDEAHKRKLKVFADAPTLAVAKSLVKADVDGLISSVRDQEVDNEFVALMKDKKKPYAPSLTSLEAKFMYADKLTWLGDQVFREVYPAALTAYLVDPAVTGQFRRDSKLPKYREEFATASKNLKKLAEAGAEIAFGTGSGLPDTFPGYFEHRELELMVNAGVSPADAIKAATSVSANALGATDLGALAPGKKANFLVLSSNPLDDIKNTKDIDKVYVGGHDVDRQENIRGIQVDAPRVTAEQRQHEADVQRQEEIAAQEAREKHYGNGKFVLTKTPLSVAPGLSIQTPRRSQASKAPGGPPYKVTVSMAGASGADLRAFYAETLRATSAGDCWEKANPLDGKKFRICPDASQGKITLNITVQ